ncbi:MAG TPA: hypothetical protein VKD22_07490 [Ramlibacter sp.]|nr:hypothetical protein [Ramlibacter sp.]
MDRRAATALVGTFILGGCGGGGSGEPAATSSAPGPATSAPPGSAPAPAPVTAAATSRNIAIWGDSLTPAVAANLQYLCPDRTVFDGGVNGQTSTQIAARQMADQGRMSWIAVLWYGANNPGEPAQIEADVAASIAALAAAGNNRFLVLSVVNEATPESIRGGPVYATIIQTNTALASRYPANYFDIRSYLVAQFDPNQPQDVIDNQNDVPPTSLRYDEIHLRNPGSLLVAAKIKELVEARGW